MPTTVFTLAQYQAAGRALAAGVTSISVEGRKTDYMSRDDLMRNIALMKAELQAAGLLPPDDPTPIRAYRLVTTKGL